MSLSRALVSLMTVLRLLAFCVQFLGILAFDVAALRKNLTCGSYLLQHRSVISHQQPSSNTPISSGCVTGSDCTVPSGQTWIVDASITLRSLTINGTLLWDRTKNGMVLSAGFVLVNDGGYLQIGTVDRPMNLAATVYITKNTIEHPSFGHRFLGGLGSARIDIHGRSLIRTWTLLSKTGSPGQTQLLLKDDPAAMGWRVGDRIGVATTNQGSSTIHRITAVGPFSVLVAEPLQSVHWGGSKQIQGRSFEMAAEVVNLERSIVITGDHDDFETTLEGFHTIMTGTGYMAMRFARVEYCGQRPLMGRYCLHFHMMRKCPRCIFQGNAIFEGMQIGITIHGTHQSFVDQNIVWNARANGIYTEDGNEMNNTISRNVMICTRAALCTVDWTGGVASQTAGIFMIGMTNDVIENRIVQYQNGIWTPGSFRGDGRGAALGKVCPQFFPFGVWKGNVCHDNARFGLYLDNQMPRNVQRDEDGYLVSKAGCKWFTPDGKDNGVVQEIRDEYNWHNLFVGQYATGDLQYVNYTSINNANPFYWKQSKNLADGRIWHMVNSTFAHDPTDPFGVLTFLGPAGPFTFGIKDTVFLGGAHSRYPIIRAGHDCGLGGGGGPCNVQYLLDNVDFSKLGKANQMKFQFGNLVDSEQSATLPIFVSKDQSLSGFKSIVSGRLTGFLQVPGCIQLGADFDNGIGCNMSIRRLNLWSANSGNIVLSGQGYLPFNSGGWNQGQLAFDSQHGGYGAPVVMGQTYTIAGSLQNGTVIEFSDAILSSYFGEAGTLTLGVGGFSCQISSRDNRRFIASMGKFLVDSTILRSSDANRMIVNGRLLCNQSPKLCPEQTTSLTTAAATTQMTPSPVTRARTTLTTTPTSTKTTRASIFTSVKSTSMATATGNWVYYARTNCYDMHGGTTLGNPPGTFTIAACRSLCFANSACQGITMRSGFVDGTSPCWLVGNVQINGCIAYPDYDFWLLNRQR